MDSVSAIGIVKGKDVVTTAEERRSTAIMSWRELMEAKAADTASNLDLRKSILQRAIEAVGWQSIYFSLDPLQRFLLQYHWRILARPEQIPVFQPGQNTWMYLGGRGTGKTRGGGEFILQKRREGYRRICLTARTAADVRDTLIEGESGIMNIAPPWERPIYEPSKRRLRWPEVLMSLPGQVVGRKVEATATTFSGDEPDQLRGPNHDLAWFDELASWQYLEEAHSNAMLGLRLNSIFGGPPLACITTTPRPIKAIRQLLRDPSVVSTVGTTYDNVANLAQTFIQTIVKKFEGTRLGMQELMAILLEDNPDALFNRDDIDKARISKSFLPQLKKIVVAVDPAVTSGEAASDTGIMGVGIDFNNPPHYYILADRSCHEKPMVWARRALILYFQLKANKMVGEANNGGDLIETVIKSIPQDKDSGIETSGRDIKYKVVKATRGKVIRAEPSSSLCQQGRLHLVGHFPELEDQMCQWSPDSGEKSPDRLDAMVWGVTELMGEISAGILVL